MRPTLIDIAKAAGVSHMTVSRVMRDAPSVDPATRANVQNAARRLGYRPNAAAKTIVSGRFNCVTLLLGMVADQSALPDSLLFALHDQLLARNLRLQIARLPESTLSDSLTLPSVLTEWVTDGLLIDYTHGIPRAMITAINAARLPTVWLNTRRRHDCVRPDDRHMGRMATCHLIAQGHRKIHYLDDTHPAATLAGAHYSVRDREKGYADAMRDAGLTPAIFRPATDDHAPATCRAAIADCAALVCYSVSQGLETACLAIAAAHRPAVITFSERPDVCTLLGCGVPYIQVPVAEEAEEAVKMLAQKIEVPNTPQKTVAVRATSILEGRR